MRAVRRLHLLGNLRQPRRRLPRWLAPSLLLGVALLLISPYLTLWRLNQAALGGSPSDLSGLVDIDEVRDQIRRRLNKDAASSIGDVSGPFIQWIEQGIRETGNETLSRTVTLPWLQQLLASRAEGDRGFLPQVRYAFYDPPNGFLVRIGPREQGLLHLRMELRPLGWRVVAVYY